MNLFWNAPCTQRHALAIRMQVWPIQWPAEDQVFYHFRASLVPILRLGNDGQVGLGGKNLTKNLKSDEQESPRLLRLRYHLLGDWT